MRMPDFLSGGVGVFHFFDPPVQTAGHFLAPIDFGPYFFRSMLFICGRAEYHRLFDVAIGLAIGARIAIAVVVIEEKAVSIAAAATAFAVKVEPTLFAVRHRFSSVGSSCKFSYWIRGFVGFAACVVGCANTGSRFLLLSDFRACAAAFRSANDNRLMGGA